MTPHVELEVNLAGRGHAHVTAIRWPDMRAATVLTSLTTRGLTWAALQARRKLAKDTAGEAD